MNYERENFLQSVAWEKANKLIGHQVLNEKVGHNKHVLMIIKKAKRGRYMEIPGGPLIDWKDPEQVKQAFELIRKKAKENCCVFIRLRPQLLENPKNLDLLKKIGAKKSPMHLAAEHTVILDLRKSEDELLSSMRRQTRYEVRRSMKLNIKVESGNSEELFREFHKVQLATAERQHFVPPDQKTLLAEREAFGKNAKIYVARTDEGKAIAYGLILVDGDEADYYEAASTDLNRKIPGAYALQWQVIRDLKKQNVVRYNLWGIAPPNQPHHRYAGVTTFKTGFGGEIVTFVPAHDIVLNKLKYAPDFLIETIRKKRRHL